MYPCNSAAKISTRDLSIVELLPTSSRYQLPFDMWMPPSSFVDKWGLVDIGQLGSGGRSNIYSIFKK
jgi:hypothetical protein